MSINFMKRVFIEEYDQVIKNEAYEYEELLTSAGNGKSIIIPDNVRTVAVTLEITGGGSGKIQMTNNLLADVRTDTGIVWIDWTAGTVVASTEDSSDPVTAIRQVNVSGNTRMMLRAQ